MLYFVLNLVLMFGVDNVFDEFYVFYVLCVGLVKSFVVDDYELGCSYKLFVVY